MALLIIGSLVSPVDNRSYKTLPNALIYVGDDGLIKAINHIVGVPITTIHIEAILGEVGHCGEFEILHLARGEFLIPGFIDTHTHAPQFPNVGAGQQYELLKWLENVTFPMEAKFKNVDFARKAYTKIVKRIIDAGTTTCCYYGTLHLEATKELARIVHEYGQRAFIGKCNMDRESPSYYVERTDESVPHTEELIKYIRLLTPSKDGSLYVYPVLTPRFAIATTDELLKRIRVLVDSDPLLTIQTHISENPSEVRRTKELFKHLSKPEKPITYAGVYDHYHLLRNNTILAHAVYLEEEEWKLVKEKNCGISHCPTSNFNLTSGVAKVGDMLDRGVKVGLGTDVSGGFSPSILTAVRHASIAAKVVAIADLNSFAYRPLTVATLFWLATLGGAQVCNLERKAGSLEVGKSFDAIVVNIRNTSTPSPPPVSPHNLNLWGVGDDEDLGLDIRRRKDNNSIADGDAEVDIADENQLKEELDAMLERLLFCGDDRNLRRVYVQGRWIGGTEGRYDSTGVNVNATSLWRSNEAMSRRLFGSLHVIHVMYIRWIVA
ncbi:guanine deaminase [Thelephora ganbajun]|uniref:Guanine deaminase n=1 Tax=Thelephora ganbajun TaxID=370292 RepID=A0ACB6Z6Y9_THEGA|nr:guanine deaminase [Thelephora ganbajun]